MDLLNEGDKPSQQAVKAETPSYSHAAESDTASRVEALIDAIRSSHADITSDYNDWLKVGFALAGEFGESGRGYFHAISSLYPDYNQDESDRKYTECLKSDNGRTDISTLFYLAKNQGITLAVAYKVKTVSVKNFTSSSLNFNPVAGGIFNFILILFPVNQLYVGKEADKCGKNQKEYYNQT